MSCKRDIPTKQIYQFNFNLIVFCLKIYFINLLAVDELIKSLPLNHGSPKYFLWNVVVQIVEYSIPRLELWRPYWVMILSIIRRPVLSLFKIFYAGFMSDSRSSRSVALSGGRWKQNLGVEGYKIYRMSIFRRNWTPPPPSNFLHMLKSSQDVEGVLRFSSFIFWSLIYIELFYFLFLIMAYSKMKVCYHQPKPAVITWDWSGLSNIIDL